MTENIVKCWGRGRFKEFLVQWDSYNTSKNSWEK